MKILILGGIKEAVILASKLVNEGHDVTSSLAGRTKEPEPIKGKTRVGGFGGVDGLANYLKVFFPLRLALILKLHHRDFFHKFPQTQKPLLNWQM